ncbi:MAG: T9SS type A sorting domain-containing protein, partial [Leptolyngbya sp. SIO3F4]|nr:T9SS type A sorting domain-containing protein [Leptolyngbya sp. SIO3F4]
ATDLVTVLEHGVSAWAPGATPGQFPQVGGVKFSFDPTQPANSRIVNMVLMDDNGMITDTVLSNGMIVGNPNRLIRIVTLNFLAGGGDGYPFDVLGIDRVDLDTVITVPGAATFTGAGSEQDAMAEYLSQFYSTTPFRAGDTEMDQDNRIQIIGEKLVDDVLSGVAFRLHLLHASDLEGGVAAVDRAPNFAAIVEAFQDAFSGTVTISAGDNYIPGPFYNAAGDRPTFRDNGTFNDIYNIHFGTTEYDGLREGPGRVDVSIMNIIGFDASCIGNHEFDQGADAIEQIIEEDFRAPAGPSGDRWVGAQFPYLSANLDFSNSGDLGNLVANQVLPSTDFVTTPLESASGNSSFSKIAPATYIELEGARIGVVGATTPLIESISSTEEVTVQNPGAGTNDMNALASIIQPWIDSLINNHGVNKVIVVSHLQQYQLEVQLSGLLTGVDIMIAGGSDALFANGNSVLWPGDVADEPYPILTQNADNEPVAIVSTDGEYSYVGRLFVGFDAQGVLIPASIDSTVSGPYPSSDANVTALWGSTAAAFADFTKGRLVQILTDAVEGIVIAKDGNTFGFTDVYLDGRREKVRTEETNFGNMTADANLWQAQQFDPSVQVSLKNGGGIRAAIGEVVETSPGTFEFLPPQANPTSGKQDREVSQLDIENSLRFNNVLSLLDLSATDLKEVVEHGVAAWAPGSTPGQMCQVGGMRFSFDPAQAAGSRIQNLAIVDENGIVTDSVVVNGAVNGDPARVIRMVTLNFLAGGGDNYPFDVLGENRVDLDTALTAAGNATFTDAGSEQDALAEYLATEYPTLAAAFGDAETEVEDDTRIQILSERQDGVFTGISDLTPHGKYRLYPNPSQGLIYLDTEGTNVENVTVMDMYGKVIRTFAGNGSPGVQTLDLSSLSKGAYILHIATETEQESRVILLQ